MLNLRIRNLQRCLAKVLALQHTHEALRRIVDALRVGNLGLERALVQPLLQFLLVFTKVVGTEAWVANNKALECESLGHDLHQVFDGVRVLGVLDVVL